MRKDHLGAVYHVVQGIKKKVNVEHTDKGTVSLCGALYTSKNGLIKHVNSKHADDLPPLTTMPCPLCDLSQRGQGIVVRDGKYGALMC